MRRATERQWILLRDKLSAFSARDFERAVLPYLEYVFPGIWRTRQMGAHDSSGIDLFTRSPKGDEFDTVVQCKGFEVLVAGGAQATQINTSATSLRKSDVRPRRYVLLHNRDARDATFRVPALAAINALVSDHVMRESAEIWEVQRLVDAVAERLSQEIRNRLLERSLQIQEDFQQSHFFATEVMEPVPVIRGEIEFSDTQVLVKPGRLDRARLAAVLPNPRGVRWALVTGPFGIGKSKAALAAALNSQRHVLLVRAADLTFPQGTSGKTGFMKSILRALVLPTNLAELVGDEEAESLAAVQLAGTLEDSEAHHSLIIDGLDENPLFSDYKFLTFIGNVLGELRCQSVLITRREHRQILIGAFNDLFAAAAKKEAVGDKTGDRLGRHKRNKPVAYVDLVEWSSEDGQHLLDLALQRKDLAEGDRARLSDLRRRLSISGEVAELAAHPLFMQMLMDLAVFGDPIPHTEDELIEIWAFRKIIRDLRSHPHLVPAGMDLDAYTTQMFSIMTSAAVWIAQNEHITNEHNDPIDTIDETELQNIATKFLPDLRSIVDISLSSLLVPSGPRKQGKPRPLRFRFFHARIRQYFSDLAVKNGIASRNAR